MGSDPVGHHGGDAAVHVGLTAHGGVSDADAGHVGDRVERARGGSSDHDAEVPGPVPGGDRRTLGERRLFHTGTLRGAPAHGRPGRRHGPGATGRTALRNAGAALPWPACREASCRRCPARPGTGPRRAIHVPRSACRRGPGRRRPGDSAGARPAPRLAPQAPLDVGEGVQALGTDGLPAPYAAPEGAGVQAGQGGFGPGQEFVRAPRPSRCRSSASASAPASAASSRQSARSSSSRAAAAAISRRSAAARSVSRRRVSSSVAGVRSVRRSSLMVVPPSRRRAARRPPAVDRQPPAASRQPPAADRRRLRRPASIVGARTARRARSPRQSSVKRTGVPTAAWAADASAGSATTPTTG